MSMIMILKIVLPCCLLVYSSAASVSKTDREIKNHFFEPGDQVLVPLNNTIQFLADILPPKYIFMYPQYITLSTVSRKCANENSPTKIEREARNSSNDESQCVAQAILVYDGRRGKESMVVKCCQSGVEWSGHTIDGEKRKLPPRSLTFQVGFETVDITLFTPAVSAEKTFKCPLPSHSSSPCDLFLALSISCDSDVDSCGSLGFYRGVEDFLLKIKEQKEHPLIQEKQVVVTKYEECQESIWPWIFVIVAFLTILIIFNFNTCLSCCSSYKKSKTMYKHKVLTEH